MTHEEKQQFNEMKHKVDSLFKSDRYLFLRNVELQRGKKIIGGIYCGSVASGGTANSLPTGWSVAKTATGKYTVTHTLSLTNYTVVATPASTLGQEIDVNSKGSTSFKVETFLFNSFADADFDFIVMIY